MIIKDITKTSSSEVVEFTVIPSELQEIANWMGATSFTIRKTFSVEKLPDKTDHRTTLIDFTIPNYWNGNDGHVVFGYNQRIIKTVLTEDRFDSSFTPRPVKRDWFIVEDIE